MIGRLIVRGAAIGLGAIALMALGALSTIMVNTPAPAIEAAVVVDDSVPAIARVEAQLRSTQLELERAHQILDYSARYNIPADLAAVIYDNAVAEGIAPAIGFRLVQIESNFQNNAASHMAAIGLTQLRLPTARAYEPNITATDLMTPALNLRIGFRYLRDLLRQFGNDHVLALEAYNKGPTLLAAQQAMGAEIGTRYSTAVLRP